MNYKIDLHAHSILSRDGSITLEQYRKALDSKLLDYIAITDHNQIDFALSAQQHLGERIIVGEEVRTKQGDFVALFIKKYIARDLNLDEAMAQVQSQNGLIMVPHPAEEWRRGMNWEMIESKMAQIDLIESYNSRSVSFDALSKIENFSLKNNIPHISVSDSHDSRNLGRAYCEISAVPTKDNLVSLMSQSIHFRQRAKLWSRMSPILNKFRKKYSI